MNTLQKETRKEIFLMNGISPGMFQKEEVNIYMRKINTEEAKRIIQNKTIKSYIGHSATAQALSLLLQIEVPTNRSQLKLEKGELIVFTLNGRLPEGQILTTVDEIIKIGFSLWYVEIR